ncbi:MAG: hypothetical protein J0H16_00040 [Alicycliphilus denitrificans]|nr:hypothetical protein [Alicycliphilus denitrificans]
MKKHALHALLALNVALVLVLAWLWIDKTGHLRNVHWQPPSPQTTDYAAMVPALPGPAPADTSQFIAMLDRPLFSPTRRPPPPPPPPQAPEPTDNLSAAQLSGLYQGQGDGGIIVRIGDKHRRVRLNDSVEGWILSAIQERSATFSRGGQSRVLQLPRAALTSAPVQPPAVVQPPAAIRPPTGAAARPAASPSAPAPRADAKPLQPVFGGS